jgi:hypothetical protein
MLKNILDIAKGEFPKNTYYFDIALFNVVRDIISARYQVSRNGINYSFGESDQFVLVRIQL